MAYVIAEPCNTAACNQECVDVCPVDAIHGPKRSPALRLYIDPGECICCGACEPECPTRAIYEEEALPPEWQDHRERNASFFRSPR
jgi:NAD-dependent dihydropyrimidine dehydrogenase PreA subunit